MGEHKRKKGLNPMANSQDHPHSVLDIKEIKGPSVPFILLWGWLCQNLGIFSFLPHLQINPQRTPKLHGWMDAWLASSEAPSCSSHFLPLDASTTNHIVTSLKTEIKLKIWPINLITAVGRNSIDRDRGGEMEGALFPGG